MFIHINYTIVNKKIYLNDKVIVYDKNVPTIISLIGFYVSFHFAFYLFIINELW